VAAALLLLDDDGTELELDADEAAELFGITDQLEAATVSSCPDCRSRVIAAVALVDLLDEAPPFARSPDLVELADDAPTLHVYAVDLTKSCAHPRWRDPLFDEWAEVVEGTEPDVRA
jgi:hypothetical protein